MLRSAAKVLLCGLCAFQPYVLATAAPGDALANRLHACGKLSIDSERLACFDRTVEALAAGEAHAQDSTTPQAVFGLTNADNAGKAQSERQEIDQISARVSKVDTAADATLLVTLDNGQVWRTQEVSRTLQLEPGHIVTIARAALGSFRLSTGGGRVIRVKRIH